MKLNKSILIILFLAVSGALYFYANQKHKGSSAEEPAFAEKSSQAATKKRVPLVVATAPSKSFANTSAASSSKLNSVASQALPPSGTKPELLAQLIDMQKNDFDNVRNFLSSTMNEIVAQISEELAEEGGDEEQQGLVAKITKATEEALDYIEKEIATTYNEEFTAAELQELITIQQDPIYRTMREGSNVNDLQEFKQDFKNFVDNLNDNPPSQKRAEIVQAIVENSNLKDILTTMNQSLGEAEGGAGGEAQNKPAAANAAEDAAFAQQYEELKKQQYQGVLFSSRNLTDEQLAHVHKLQQTPTMKKGQAIQSRLLPKIMQKTTQTLSQVME